MQGELGSVNSYDVAVEQSGKRAQYDFPNTEHFRWPTFSTRMASQSHYGRDK